MCFMKYVNNILSGIESGLFFFNRPEWEIKQTLLKLQKSCNFTICKVAELDNLIWQIARKYPDSTSLEGKKCKNAELQFQKTTKDGAG